jgi:hypothetical protein
MNTTLSKASLPTIFADVHAVLISFPVDIGVTSRLNTLTHSGISLSCFLFPGAMSALSPHITVSPTLAFFHASTYLFSPSAKLSNAILDVLYGSYSTLATFAGIFALSYHVKSINLYNLLCPPHIDLVTAFPELFLPHVLPNDVVRDFSGLFLDNSEKSYQII